MESNTEKKDIRVPITLLDKIEKYQEREAITNRSSALLELARIGLKNPEINIEPIPRGHSQRIDIRIPSSLLERIGDYQKNQDIKTLTGAMKNCVQKGLMVEGIK